MMALLRQIGYVAAVALACFYAFVVLRGPNGIPAMLERNRQAETLEKEIRDLDARIQDKKNFLDEVRRSPELREREIRRQLNKVKPGETIIYLEGKPGADSGR
jgi:cell division protein FtsB